MSIADGIVIGIIAAAVAALMIVRKVKEHKKADHNGGCTGSCASCSVCKK